MAIYKFRQNNSGGRFVGPAISVYVHAETAEQANALAEAEGVYFDEDYIYDCECCGTRWDSASEWDIVKDFDAAIANDIEWNEEWAVADGVPNYIVIGG